MPISPIDFITIAPKSQEASQVHAGHEDRMTHANEAVSTQFQNQVEHNSRQTIQKANADREEYRYDAKEKGNNSFQNRQRKKKQNSNEKKEQKETIKLSNFDMKF